jgi:hypothetical protein
LPQHLHIVSFDVPFPANYGGVIDVYYKLAALKARGVHIILHCFNYGRKPAPELEQLCSRVYYYQRRTGLLSNLSLLPYTVKSRQSKELEQNLLKDDHPVLFEVLHTCYLLNDPRFKARTKIYRHSNIEHDYYRELSRSEKNILKKIYLKAEAWKLERFESILRFADVILAVNREDTQYFKAKYPQAETHYLPSFHPDAQVVAQPGRGSFALFHGNLSVSENYEAALWLMEQVFAKLPFKCVIAGLNPPAFLVSRAGSFSNVELIASPPEAEMNRLLREAQVHVLYTAQPTGLKLKLLNVLFKGRFVICNAHMVAGTGVMENNGLMLCNSADEFIRRISTCMNRDFSEQEIAARKALTAGFDNAANAEKLLAAVFNNVDERDAQG